MKSFNFLNLFFAKRNSEIISFYSVNRLSETLAKAFAKPIHGMISSEWKDGYSDTIHSAFFFGNPELWFLFEKIKKHKLSFYYADKAYFDRSNYFRITKNSLQLSEFADFSSKRFERLKIPILPRRYGDKILLCPQSETFFRLNGLSREQWIKNTIQEIRKYSDRPIEIRDKVKLDTEISFSDALKNVHAVVVYTSVAGVQSALQGVPSFATHSCATDIFSSGSIVNIESPLIPDNIYDLACALANNQWTIEEIRKGLPQEYLGLKMQ